MAANQKQLNSSKCYLKKMIIIISVCIIFAICSCVFMLQYTTFLESLLSTLDIQHAPAPPGNNDEKRLVCYFTYPDPNANTTVAQLNLTQVDPRICTHLHVGSASINNNYSIVLSEQLNKTLLYDAKAMLLKNPKLKILLWIGGGDISVKNFSHMVANHINRKLFIKSVKAIFKEFPALQGIDLDWEFPSAYDKERMHFSQLLYEIKQEYRREKRFDYLLTVAVAAVEGIAEYAYDIRELNLYADYVNLMTYDYHFYTTGTPFTGLNAPLFARPNENIFMRTLNINYSINWWLSKGIDANKLVVGLPTYGHTFTLVNPFNTKIGAPARSFGNCGLFGYATYSDVCKFLKHNLVALTFDNHTFSPYLSSNTEWISFENVESITAKANFIKSKNLGGIMVYSVNTDDTQNLCKIHRDQFDDNEASNLATTSSQVTLPLIQIIKSILFPEKE